MEMLFDHSPQKSRRSRQVALTLRGERGRIEARQTVRHATFWHLIRSQSREHTSEATMFVLTRGIFIIAMVLLGIVSMWTTYVSLNDSILPEPTIRIDLGGGTLWDCSIFALGLSVAIGLMLFALKVAIIDGEKRLNLLGVGGLTLVAFISISFNMDVLYRTADREFFIRYSNSKMRSVYENYLAEIQTQLLTKRETVQKALAKQEGELQAETEGLRQLPPGYGRVAKQEDYQLTLLKKTSAVDLASIEEAFVKKEEADALLNSTFPESIEEIERLQNQLRVIVKDVGAVSGIPLPEPVKMDSPLFAVFAKLFDLETVGIKEVFFVLLAFLLDLADIVGYSLVPNRPRKARPPMPSTVPDLPGPGLLLPRSVEDAAQQSAANPRDEAEESPITEVGEETRAAERHARRPFYFRRRL